MKKISIGIIKASGEREEFAPEKLMRSLTKAGAQPEMVERIMGELAPRLHEGMSTRAIYSMAFSLLKKESRPQAARYRIKKAMMELGPSGHPFERLIGELLKTQGYRVQVGRIVQGHCVTHEIDVEAENDDRHIMVECKYHNQQGVKSDVKIALYVHARFQDIDRYQEEKQLYNHHIREAWLVTNTKFSSDAIRYGTCAGLHLIGWNYPEKEGLQELIVRYGLYPLTCLTSLTISQKNLLLAQGHIVAKELSTDDAIFRSVGLKDSNILIVKREIEGMINNKVHNNHG